VNRLPRDNWQHTALAVALLLAGLAAVYALVVLPALNARAEYREREEDLAFQQARFTATAAQMEQLRTELDRLAGGGMDDSGFLAESAPGLAAADLQKEIQALVESSGGLLLSIQTVQDDEDLFPAVTVKLHMRAGMDALLRVINGLETGSTVLLIDNVYLQSRTSNPVRNARPRARAPESDLIEARLEATGYIYQGTGA